MEQVPSQVNPPIDNLFFSSALDTRYRSDLERLMFFNPQQNKFRQAVSELVDRYGNPKIVENGGLLRLQIGKEASAQTLFCCDRATDGDLVAVVVYVRESKENLAIIHLAVREEYTISGRYGDRLLFLHLIQKVKEIGARLKGVEYIKILYDRSGRKILVSHAIR
jgi:hypothetical protein